MTENLDGQISWFDQDSLYMKTSPEPSAPTEEKISEQSSQRLSKSQTNQLPLFLCLKADDGQKPDVSGTRWETGVLPGGLTMLSTTVFRNGEKESAYWLTSEGLRRQRSCLTLNMSERPRMANPSRLSEILEESPDSKYSLSAKACQGILNRAERRGKELPKELKAALIAQSVCKETELTEPIPPDATEPDGVGGVTPLTQSTDQPCAVSRNEPVNQGGAKESSFSVNTPEPCQRSTTKAYSIQGNTIDRDAKQNGTGISADVSHTLDGADRHGVAYGIDQQGGKGNASYTKNVAPTLAGDSHGTPHAVAFKAGNGSRARSIGYQKEKAPTLSAADSGTNRVLTVMAVDCRNGTENAWINGTLQAKEQGSSLNLNNVVRTAKP